MARNFKITVNSRCPYFFGDAPLLVRFRRFSLGSGLLPLRNFSKFLGKIWYRVLGNPLRGDFRFDLGSDMRIIRVESHNSHFETVLSWPQASYEPVVRALIDYFLPSDGILFDIGANWGYYTFFANSRPEFTGTVHAFEPYPPSLEDFASVQTQSGLTKNIVLHNIGLSDHEGVAHLVLPHSVKAAQASFDSGAEGVPADIARLDTLNLPAPDLIKLDVEGHELEMLKGAGETLEQHKPVIVFENLLLSENIEKSILVIGFLTSIGYHVFVPELGVAAKDGTVTITFTAIDQETRAQFPAVTDLCAIHGQRLDELLEARRR